MPIDKALISGSTSMLLLRLLEEKDMYGYEMIETLESRSNHVFSLKAGTLYPLLHTLEEKQYLTCYEREANGKTRKYYSLTREGRRGGLLLASPTQSLPSRSVSRPTLDSGTNAFGDYTSTVLRCVAEYFTFYVLRKMTSKKK